MTEKLKKELGLLDVFCIATGAMISSGLFILPGMAFAKAGPGVVFSYLLAGLLCIPTLLSMAWNSSHGLEMLEKFNLKKRLGSEPVIKGG